MLIFIIPERRSNFGAAIQGGSAQSGISILGMTRTVQIVVWAIAVLVGLAGVVLYSLRGNQGAAAFQSVFLVVCAVGLALSIRRKQRTK